LTCEYSGFFQDGKISSLWNLAREIAQSCSNRRRQSLFLRAVNLESQMACQLRTILADNVEVPTPVGFFLRFEIWSKFKLILIGKRSSMQAQKDKVLLSGRE
jgi:hypothetical protein